MKVLGIVVTAQFHESAFTEKYDSLLSTKINSLSEKAKKQVLLGFILLSVGVLGVSLIQGKSTESSTSLGIPVWEPPLIYYDSLGYKPITKP